MRTLYPRAVFPPHLEPPAARSMSLLFIMQEWLIAMEQLEISKAPASTATVEPFFLTSLDKLCFYCDVLLQASKIEHESLPMVLEEMRHTLLSFKTRFLFAKRKDRELSSFESQMGEFLAYLEQKFRSFFSALVPFLQEARTDENVLIYLLEKKQTFNRYLTPRAIEEMLQGFFPAGHSHLRAVICEGFTRRGFSSFLAEKESLIEELEWDAPTTL